MTRLILILLTIALTFIVKQSNGQVSDKNIRLKVLRKAIVGKELHFGKWKDDGSTTETDLTYLGSVTTIKGKTFKILSSIWIWGLSGRATSRILVFNDKNQYVGNYHVTVPSDLPTSMKNGKLIFKNTDEYCDKNTTTVIDLKKGLPKQFFRKCKNKSGDIYSFDNE